ncbi:hypothetical protein K435DRAFT_709899 [Dendrothele bispora CBS 962.96]|uniref:COQ9 C-terminal domain-containing protein n=1 Tax=Dendrothele bispora (strain CBS 962.96) TaxID=1314807 RepID=A0A4S8MVA2_DENBC|nr:hypothetical protein K435DRAFT_709899 [Dendrothele bispora CBS 962.96]
MSRIQLLKIAVSLVPTFGFTREALSRSVLALPSAQAHLEPLSDRAVSALFGNGDNSRKTLIEAWLQEGLGHMKTVSSPTMKEVLKTRLEYNQSALQYLPEAFALLASPERGLPPLDPRPAATHAITVADEACYITGDTSLQFAWYPRRLSLAAIYTAAELHQLTSPQTAVPFLESLLDGSSTLKNAFDETQLFGSYVFKSWGGIIRSRGIF